MAVDLAISVAGKLIEVLEINEAIKEICRMWGYKDELEDLKKTITTIKNVLLDAECKRDLSNVQQGYIVELKGAVYDADDLFDEFRTLAELKLVKGNKRGKFFGKVCHFFSSEKGKLGQAYRISKRVKEIKVHLDAIANDYKKFGFGVDHRHIVRRREDTFSYVDAKNIIGRDKDKEAIIDMLMDPKGDDEGFHFLTIVGVGGLGKTALAQLIFNDEKITNEFSSSRFWVCVSDQDGVSFDLKTILFKILEVANKKNVDNNSSMEYVRNTFQDEFRGKKYLLLLDDVWNKDRDNWMNLKQFLMMGSRGSKIVVTSRSEETSSIIGGNHFYKLEGLSEKDSQCLFEMSAFGLGEKHPELRKIGENIARKCCGVPLAIKVVGSLLYRKDISKWQSIERSGLIDIGEDYSYKILSILKLSYFNLAPSLKSCFSYCAVFPKGTRMEKENLICLWMAQGYVVPLDGGQSVKDAAEEHLMILMQRCFFQDIWKDEYGNIKSVKIHDLMHDVAQEEKNDEIFVVKSEINNLKEKFRHVNITAKSVDISLCRSKIHSFIYHYGSSEPLLNKKMKNLIPLRVLDFSYTNIIEKLPQIINKLLLLRYLNISYNRSLEVIPESITKLYNLQTLLLRGCSSLREIPQNISNLIKLRHLDLYDCTRLNEIPLDILQLRNLKVLPYFAASSEISEEQIKMLQQILNKLKGKLSIRTEDKPNNMVKRDLESMKLRVKLMIDFGYKGEWVMLESVLIKLELPPYLNELCLSDYNGKTIPWSPTSLLHNLICIKIELCRNLEQIPMLSKCPNLKSLRLFCLDSVEYMENDMIDEGNNTKAREFFPSLESLEIIRMEKLKGWWKGDFSERRLRFPCLCNLEIWGCPNLAVNIVCPSMLEKLELGNNSERLIITGEFEELREMRINKVNYLKLLSPTKNYLTSLELTRCIEVESVFEPDQSWATSLQTLTFFYCESLKRLPRLDHLIALKDLIFCWNDELSIYEEDEEPWKSLPKSLRKLAFFHLPKMKSLPKGLQHLTFLEYLSLNYSKNIGEIPEWINCLSSLQTLQIWECESIKSLPEAIKDLTSLKELAIWDCPDLEKRCEKPNGEDFPKIQHIPNIFI